jgi:aspartyl-tRNA(Asn)/glutamyl-tRNA(Gln) amidotransferase subunit C
VKPVSHAITIANAFREDIVRESLRHELSLSNAPEARGNCFLVPKVVE